MNSGMTITKIKTLGDPADIKEGDWVHLYLDGGDLGLLAEVKSVLRSENGKIAVVSLILNLTNVEIISGRENET